MWNSQRSVPSGQISVSVSSRQLILKLHTYGQVVAGTATSKSACVCTWPLSPKPPTPADLAHMRNFLAGECTHRLAQWNARTSEERRNALKGNAEKNANEKVNMSRSICLYRPAWFDWPAYAYGHVFPIQQNFMRTNSAFRRSQLWKMCLLLIYRCVGAHFFQFTVYNVDRETMNGIFRWIFRLFSSDWHSLERFFFLWRDLLVDECENSIAICGIFRKQPKCHFSQQFPIWPQSKCPELWAIVPFWVINCGLRQSDNAMNPINVSALLTAQNRALFFLAFSTSISKIYEDGAKQSSRCDLVDGCEQKNHIKLNWLSSFSPPIGIWRQ